MFTLRSVHAAAIRSSRRGRKRARFGRCVVRPCKTQDDQRMMTISGMEPLREAVRRRGFIKRGRFCQRTDVISALPGHTLNVMARRSAGHPGDETHRCWSKYLRLILVQTNLSLTGWPALRRGMTVERA